MSEEQGTLEAIGAALCEALRPVIDACASDRAFSDFMRLLGWDVNQVIAPIGDLAGLVKGADDFLSRQTGANDDSLELLGQLERAFNAIRGVGSIGGNQLPNSVDASAFRQEFPTQLRDYLIVEYLRGSQPSLGAWLQLLGVIRLNRVPASSKRIEYVRREIAWSDLGRVLSDPGAVFRNAYRWGADDFGGPEFLQALYALGDSYGLHVHTGPLSPVERRHLHTDAIPTELGLIHNVAVRWALLESAATTPALFVGIGAAVLPKTADDVPGLAVVPYVQGSTELEFPVTDYVSARFAAKFDLAQGVSLQIRPDKIPQLKHGFLSGVASAGVELEASLQIGADAPLVLIGQPSRSRLQLGSATVRGGARLNSGASGGTSTFVEWELSEAALVISTGSADGFLSKLLGDGVTIDFAGTLGLDSEHGLYFTGSSGLEIEIPTHIQLGPIEIHSAAIAIKLQNEKIPIELTATIGANFGFLTALIENVGIRAELSTPPNGGALGPFDFAIGPRPPNGIAVGVDAGVVKGFGYFYFDPEKEEYGGALELTIADLFSVKAFGLVNTRMPNGEKGFSMVVIMTFEFPDPGIQLGLGFRLLGVGGIIGVQRNLDLDELVQRMRSGALLRLLYPKSLDANVIVPLFDDLRAIFPIGTSTLLGPFFKLAYGTPTLVDIKIGVIFEIPGNIAILGVVSAVLPKEEGAVLRLTVSFVGIIEPAKKRLWFFAVLFDSRLVSFTLEGELGVLAQYGNDAELLLSAGGFHPRYDPPPLPFPNPARLALEILNKDNAKIRAESYFAIWSGGVMFGVRAELYFGYSEFKLAGDVHWDCLIRFSPFSFQVDIGASLSAEVFGVGCFSVHIALHLEGPKKYRASGQIKIAIRFAPDIHKRIDKEWGSEAGGQLPSIQIFDLVAAEIDRPANWGTELPNGARLLVTLRDRAQGDTAIVVHPSGRVRVAQGTVPLGLTLDKVGNQRPSDVNRFTLAPVGVSLTKVGDVLDRFAAGQFLDIGEAALSRADFEQMNAGILVDGPGDEYATGHAIRRRVRYEQIVIDTNYKRSSKRFSSFSGKLFTRLLKNASVTKSVLSKAQRVRLNSIGDTVAAVTEEVYSVARQVDNRSLDASPLTFPSQAAAHEYMKTKIAANPALRGQLHVIPSHELAA